MSIPSSEARNALRSKVFATKPRSRIVILGEGVEIEVIQPSVGVMLDSVSEENIKKRIMRMLINSCFVPGTSEPLFEEADFDNLMNMPQGGTYQALIDAVQENMDLPKTVEKAALD